MVKIWYMNDPTIDQKLENQTSPPLFLETPELFEETGVEYIKLNLKTFAEDGGALDRIKTARNYNYEDEIKFSEKFLQDNKNELKSFYIEHLHTNEEIRFIVDGSGYFDVRE